MMAVKVSTLHGVIPALVTPFREDERLDCGAWQAIIDALIAGGVHGLFVSGSQGEFYALDREERMVGLRFCRQAIAGRVATVANVGCVTTRDTVTLARQAVDLGYDAITVVTPYYVQPTQWELADHLIEVCRSVRAPVLAYNFPHHGGTVLEAETVTQVAAKCENLIGLKDSSGSLAQAVAYLQAVPDREFAVFTGGDHLMLEALEAGCAGTVTAAANVAPKLFVELYECYRAGNLEKARELQALATEMGDALGLHTFPSVVKAALQLAGLPVGPCRKPVGKLPEDAMQKLSRVVEHLRAENLLVGAPRRARA
jgi:4-hydroxy-tetrahydrodipicolinate synthase